MPRFKLVRRARNEGSTPIPVLAKTNSAGAPLAFTITVTGYLDSYYWNLQVAADSGFTTPLPGDLAIRDEVRIVTTTDYTDDDVSGTVEADAFEALLGQGAGARYARIRLGYNNTSGDGFTWGAWSNTVNETITTASAVTWDATRKSAAVVLSGGNLVASGLDGTGGPEMVLAQIGKTTGKWYFEVHVVVTGTPFGTAVVGFASYLPDGGVVPGSASADHISYHWSGDVYRNSANGGGASGSTEYYPAGTHIIGVAVDCDNDKVWFAKTNTFGGSPAAGTGGHAPTNVSPYTPMCGAGDDGVTLSLKTVTSQLTYSPPAGFTAFGGN